MPAMSLTPSTRRSAAAAVPRLAPGRYLAIDDGPDTVLVPLRAEVTRVSRSPAADITLDDAAASRRHALFVAADDGVDVVDDRSLNGISVNGERVERRRLADGDTVLVGRTTLRYIEVREAADEPMPTARIEPV
jgi:pSer/pThr/pTyr-binding forkhead associated (FHA) protein